MKPSDRKAPNAARSGAANRPAWVYIAPASLVVLFLLVSYAVGSSCAVRGCKDKSASKDAKASTPDHVKRWYTVKKGDSAGAIALQFGITEELLVACNPDVIDFYNLDIGLRLRVDEETCKKRQAAADAAGADLIKNNGTGATKGVPNGDDPATTIDESDPNAMVDADRDGIPDAAQEDNTSSDDSTTSTTDTTDNDTAVSPANRR
jgi:LysM repeat protein